MRKLKIIGSVVLALIVAIFVLRELVLYETYKAPELPPSAPDDLPPLVSESLVMMKMSVGLAQLSSMANDLIPVDFLSIEPDPTDALSEDRSKVEITRGTITVSERNGRVSVIVPIVKGRINIKGKFGVKEKNKGILGWIESIGNVNVSGTVDDVKGRFFLSLLPQLRPDWTINPQASAELDVNKAKFSINHVGDISVRGEIEDAFEDSRDKELKKFTDALNASAGLRARVADAWESAFIVEKPTEVPAWVVVKPVGIVSAPTTVSDGKVNFFVGIRAEALVSISEVRPENPVAELPNLEIVESESFGTWNLNVPVRVDYQTISDVISREVKGLAYDDGGVEVKATSISVFPSGRDLGLRISLTARPSWWSKVKIEVNALATPVLDSVNNTLGVSNLRLDVASDSVLVDGLTWLTRPLLISKIENATTVDLAALESSAIEDVSAATTDMLSTLPANVQANLDFENIKIVGLQLAEDFAYVVFSTSGRISADLQDLAE